MFLTSALVTYTLLATLCVPTLLFLFLCFISTLLFFQIHKNIIELSILGWCLILVWSKFSPRHFGEGRDEKQHT